MQSLRLFTAEDTENTFYWVFIVCSLVQITKLSKKPAASVFTVYGNILFLLNIGNFLPIFTALNSNKYQSIATNIITAYLISYFQIFCQTPYLSMERYLVTPASHNTTFLDIW